MRRLAVAAAALLALAGGVSAAPAAAAPRPLVTATGVLGKRTTITWSGTASIRLSLAKHTQYAGGDIDLVTTGATYAFIRVVQPAAADCPVHHGPRCRSDRFSYIRGLHDLDPAVPPPRRHEAGTAIPPVIDSSYVDVFLFTDGQATATFTTTSLRGTYSYRPAGRPHAKAARLRSACVPLGCATPEGRSNGLVHGGETFDLKGGGWAEVYAFGGSDDPRKPSDQVHSIATCLFPNWQRPSASADPADHPYGCDDAEQPTDIAPAVVNHAIRLTPGLGHATNVPWSGARGRQYIGFQSIGAGPTPSDPRAYGIWFRYPR